MIRTSVLLFALVACTGGAPEPAAPPEQPQPEPAVQAEPAAELDARVAQAAAVAKDMASSDDPAAVLAKHGLTDSELEALMLEIASDPALSKAYRQARK